MMAIVLWLSNFGASAHICSYSISCYRADSSLAIARIERTYQRNQSDASDNNIRLLRWIATNIQMTRLLGTKNTNRAGEREASL